MEKKDNGIINKEAFFKDVESLKNIELWGFKYE